MTNIYLPEGTDLREVEGFRPVRRSDNAGIGAGSISEDNRTGEEMAQDEKLLEAERADHRARLLEAMVDIERFFGRRS